MTGVPWEPVPGRGMKEIRLKMYIDRAGAGNGIVPEPQMRDAVPRRMPVDKDHPKAYGYTIGCQGCRAKSRGQVGASHSVLGERGCQYEQRTFKSKGK